MTLQVLMRLVIAVLAIAILVRGLFLLARFQSTAARICVRVGAVGTLLFAIFLFILAFADH